MSEKDSRWGQSGISAQNKTVSIETTHRCNLHCVHCCVDADHTQKSGELDTEEMKAILKNARPGIQGVSC